MALNRELIDAYLDRILIFEGSLEPDTLALRRLLSEIESDTHLDKTDQAFVRGYLGYQFPKTFSQVDCEAEFRFVLGREPQSQLALHYLGYQCFDCGKYFEALESFNRIEPEYCQIWSRIKIDELIVCCYLHLQELREAEKLLIPLLRQSEEVETIDYPYPIELLRTLIVWHIDFSAVIGEAAWQRILELLNIVFRKHALPRVLQEELSKLSR
ncbi:hypothetical protein [Gimesia panareensis]|uniref:Uncharacterized protein n=1 Tax=Gimesia panareensis TaxID=2527978 RepID=A0A518A1C3_9PLAN|nr:hypothetical protein [Gimesia panareensis]QDT25532.1 hypothetical protein Enr10x_08290 [Gimesia panareensis]QDU48481.1 hypothetical protein Pan110_07960 [Gimesia panareensis]